ncbi:hypothetical protein HOG21_03560 [bacterium]|nr:hypothetical protein [bacterium]
MKILTDKYLSNFKKSNNDLLINIEKFKMDSKELNFDYLTQASSVYSSNIE